MKPVVLLLFSAILSFAQTNRFHVSQHAGSGGALILIKIDLSTGQSWRYDDSYQGTEIVTSEAGQKMKQRLEKIVINRLDPLNSYTLFEAVEVLSNKITHNDPENSPKYDGSTKGLNNKKKNHSEIIRAIVPKGISRGGVATNKPPKNIPGGIPGGIGTIPPNPTVDPATGVPITPSTPGALAGVPRVMIPGGLPGGLPGGHFIPQSKPPPARFPIFILSGIRSRYTIAGSFGAGIDPVTGLPLLPLGGGSAPSVDPRTGLPIAGGGGSAPSLVPGTGLPIAPVVPAKKLKAGQADDNKNNSALPPGLPPGAPSGGSPRGGVKLPGMGGGLPGMGGLMGGMGGVRKQHGHGIDPETVTINGMRGPVVNITAYAALHLVLSLVDVPLNCAIDEHGVFIFPPAEPFRFLDGNKPKFSKIGRWVEIGSSE